MSAETPLIIYFGSEVRGESLHQETESLGWTVLAATHSLQALGMYVFYVPDLVIIDSREDSEGAQQVLFHLQSVNAQPLIFISSSTHDALSLADSTGRVLPPTAGDGDIMLAAVPLLRQAMMSVEG
ncbi:hypothetical protein GC175_13000 [bacterium]|nr:hypothetical protein [bacterium]